MTLAERVQYRLRREITRGKLSIVAATVGRVDHRFITLPVIDIRDEQEILYHLNCDEYYRAESAALSSMVNAGDVVVDVGSNLGFITTILSRIVGPQGVVHSFEPSPGVFRKLECTIKLNKLSNVVAYNLGCGETPSAAQLHRITRSTGNSTIVRRSFAPHVPVESIDLVTLDDALYAKNTRVHFIKIDTEGYESRVLRGASLLLERDHPGVYIELCAKYLESSLDSIRLLRSLGYVTPSDDDVRSALNGDNFYCAPPAPI